MEYRIVKMRSAWVGGYVYRVQAKRNPGALGYWEYVVKDDKPVTFYFLWRAKLFARRFRRAEEENKNPEYLEI